MPGMEMMIKTKPTGSVDVCEMQDGHEWESGDKDGGLKLTKPIHFKKTDGLGTREVNANLENIESLSLGDENGNLDVILGYQAGKTVNCLSLEVSSNPTIDGQFGVPEFVEDNSMVRKLKEGLEKKMAEMEKESVAGIEKIRTQMKLLARVEKFLLLTTRGALTDLHVDSSTTSVFYTVLEGEKIFWIAENNEENLELYRKYELRAGEKGSELGGDPGRIPAFRVHAGEQCCHGRQEESATLQFDLTGLEEECLARARNEPGAGVLRDDVWSTSPNDKGKSGVRQLRGYRSRSKDFTNIGGQATPTSPFCYSVVNLYSVLFSVLCNHSPFISSPTNKLI